MRRRHRPHGHLSHYTSLLSLPMLGEIRRWHGKNISRSAQRLEFVPSPGTAASAPADWRSANSTGFEIAPPHEAHDSCAITCAEDIFLFAKG